MAPPPSARLRVRPGPPLRGTFTPPGDKSITHRAYLLGLIASGETVVDNANAGADCEATLRCAEMLGARVTRGAGEVTIEGRAGKLRAPDHVLDCGNSGTTLRLLAGILAGQPFESTLDGDASLRRRPVGRIIEPLRAMGARIRASDGDRVPPVVLTGGRLNAINHRCEVASAQVVSCLLLAGLFADGRTSVTLPMPARDHTQRMLPTFGVAVTTTDPDLPNRGVSYAVSGPVELRGAHVCVPGDLSAAAFFLAAAAATPGASVVARGVNVNPTRAGLLAVLERMGARVERARPGAQGGEPVADVTVTGPPYLEAAAIGAAEIPMLIDEVPAWVVLATAARGTSSIRGAAELRVKESDRLASLAANLARLGVSVEAWEDGLAIRGGPVAGGTVDAAGDHRVAMAFAVLAARATGPITIEAAHGIETSYPGFGEILLALGGDVEPTSSAIR